MKIVRATITFLFLFSVYLSSQFVSGQPTEAIGEVNGGAGSKAQGGALEAAKPSEIEVSVKEIIDNAANERCQILFEKLLFYLSISGKIKLQDADDAEGLLDYFRLTNSVLKGFELWENVETGKRKKVKGGPSLFFRRNNHKIYKKFKHLDARSDELYALSNESRKALFKFVLRQNDNVVFKRFREVKSEHPKSEISRQLKIYVVMYLLLTRPDSAVVNGKDMISRLTGAIFTDKDIADVCLDIGKTELGLDIYQKIIDRTEVNKEGVKLLQSIASRMHSDTKKLTSHATKIFDKMVREAPAGADRILILTAAAKGYARIGQFGKAALTYRKIIKEFPQADQSEKSRLDMIRLYAFKLDSVDEAIDECNAIIAEYPNTPLATRVKFLIAEICSKKNRYPEAIEQYKNLLRESQGAKLEAQVRLLMAKTHYAYKQYDRAIAELEPFMEQFDQEGKGVQARSLLAFSHLAKLEYDKTVETLREVLSKYPSDKLAPTSQYLIAYVYLSQQKYQEAREEFQKLIDDHPRNRWTREAKRYVKALRSTTVDR